MRTIIIKTTRCDAAIWPVTFWVSTIDTSQQHPNECLHTSTGRTEEEAIAEAVRAVDLDRVVAIIIQRLP